VLEYDNNDVNCERDNGIVEFDVGDVFGESDCGDMFGELGEEIIIDEVVSVDIGVFSEEGVGKEQFTPKQKISTTTEGPLELYPPPKNILFVDDVDASDRRS
jgi:hypothetical protein